MPISSVLIDDRLLVGQLVGAAIRLPRRSTVYTTVYWYYRACRAAVAGGQGQLAGPFAALEAEQQGAAIQAMLQLPDEIGLPEPRALVPEMVGVHRRHPRLNLLNLEATAAARLLGAQVLLSPPAATGVLPAVLETEGITWREVQPA